MILYLYQALGFWRSFPATSTIVFERTYHGFFLCSVLVRTAASLCVRVVGRRARVLDRWSTGYRGRVHARGPGSLG